MFDLNDFGQGEHELDGNDGLRDADDLAGQVNLVQHL